MIYSVTVTNYLGDSIKMELRNPEKSGFLIQSIDGLGPGQADIITTELAATDGGVYNSARLQSRNIVFNIKYQYKETIEDARLLSYKYFPIKKNVKLVFETENRLSEIEGYVESNEPEIFSDSEDTQISIICPNPYFYSSGPDGNQVTYFSGIEPLFEFLFSNESLTENLIEFGEIQNKQENVVTYYGDSEVGVKIYIHAVGSVSDISIYNILTREVMHINTDKIKAMTGEGIIASDDIVIDTTVGNKSIYLIRKGLTTNILNCLDKNSDWFKLSRGDNIFAFTAAEGATNLQFRIENRLLYEGI